MNKTIKLLAISFVVLIPFFDFANDTMMDRSYAAENENNNANDDEASDTNENNDSNDEEESNNNEESDANEDVDSNNDEESNANENDDSNDEEESNNDEASDANENNDSNNNEETDTSENNDSNNDEESDANENDDEKDDKDVSLMSEDGAEVSDWDEFADAVEDEEVSEILLTDDITHEEDRELNKVSNGKTINGDGHSIDFGSNSFDFSTNPELVLKNVSLNRSVNDSIFTNAETIEIDNSELDLTSDKGRIFDNVKEFTVKNGSNVEAESNSGTLTSQTLLEATGGDSEFNIESGSTVDLYSEENLVIRTGKTELNVTGENTELNIEGKSTKTGKRGSLISVIGDNSAINVNNGAEINGHSHHTSAMLMESENGEFIVDNASKLNLQSDDNQNKRGATLRFRKKGNQTFDAKNESEININKTGGQAPAVRMRNANNTFKAESGSEINIQNDGTGENQDGGNHDRNQGIYFDKGSNNVFEISDENSEINIIAKYGPAIDLNNESGEVKINPDTVFRAEGATASGDSGIIAGGDLDVTIDAPLYYDFRNNRDGGGEIFENGRNSNATFQSVQSDLSVWEKGENLDGDPNENWTLFDYTLNGDHFKNIEDTNIDDFNEDTYKGANHYSRMSGNNAKPIVDELRKPTNADQSVFGHASVPVAGEEEPRNAWTDEVHVLLEYETKDGSTEEVTASTVGKDNENDGLAVYDDEPRAGMFQGDLPDDAFIESESEIKVIDAWRGDKDQDSDRKHRIKDDDLAVIESQEAIDVTPPDPVEDVTDKDKIGGYEDITNATKRLKAKGTESDVKAHLDLDENIKKSYDDVEIKENDNFTLDLDSYLEKDDKAHVLLSDNADYYTEEDVGYKLPSTHTINEGNINPTEEMDYHDKTFEAAAEYSVQDILPEPEIHQEEINVSDEGDSAEDDVTRIGSTLEFEFTIENQNTSADDSELNNVTFKDEIPEGLELNEESVEVDGETVVEDDMSYEEDGQLLEVTLDQVLPSKERTIYFEAEVSSTSLEGEEITNAGSIKGETIRESEFQLGKPDNSIDREVVENDSNERTNPGGEILESLGDLTFESAPDLLEFKAKISTKSEEFFVNKDKLGDPLRVKDDRPEKSDWKLTAKMKEDFTGEDDSLTDALVYHSDEGEQRIGEDSAVIVDHQYESSDDEDYDEQISDEWEDSEESKQGIFLQLEPGEMKPHDYDGKVEWTLEDAP